MAPRGESLYHQHPGYRVDLEPNPQRVRIRLGTETIADSRATLLVKETKHEPVVYFPRADVRMDLLERTEHETFCPFKGHASYWTIRSGAQTLENGVWTYEDPFPEVAGLRDYVAFYVGRGELKLEVAA